MPRTEVADLIRRLCEAQQEAVTHALQGVKFEDLDKSAPESDFTIKDVLRMWVWHYTSHHRDLIRARGSIEGDNPHFHVPHFVRQANEEFGRFIGELACFPDEQLDMRPPDGGRSVREIAQHILETVTGFVTEKVDRKRQ